MTDSKKKKMILWNLQGQMLAEDLSTVSILWWIIGGLLPIITTFAVLYRNGLLDRIKEKDEIIKNKKAENELLKAVINCNDVQKELDRYKNNEKESLEREIKIMRDLVVLIDRIEKRLADS